MITPSRSLLSQPTGERQQSGQGRWLISYADLVSVLLAFFVILVSLSQQENEKAKAVLARVNDTFAVSSERAMISAALDGDGKGAEATRAFLEHLGAAAVDLLGPAAIERGAADNELRVGIPVHLLFAEGSPDAREAQTPFLDRTVAALSGPPPGFALDVEITVAGESPNGSAADDRLSVLRAGGLARRLIERGAAPDALTIAVSRRSGNQVIFVFRIHPNNKASEGRPGGEGRAIAAPSSGQPLAATVAVPGMRP